MFKRLSRSVTALIKTHKEFLNFYELKLIYLYTSKYTSWRRAWQPTPVFLPGESHGQRSLAGSMGPQSQTGLSSCYRRLSDRVEEPWVGRAGVLTLLEVCAQASGNITGIR